MNHLVELFVAGFWPLRWVAATLVLVFLAALLPECPTHMDRIRARWFV
ncbi:MAG: hypothetical protein JWO46_2446 [Nocardioidaceae bacterium]|nr:hypothetical protein [Nocardioidaceae bacterium]